MNITNFCIRSKRYGKITMAITRNKNYKKSKKTPNIFLYFD